MKFIRLGYKLFIAIFIFWMLLSFNLRLDTIIIGLVFSGVVTVASYNVLFDETGFLYASIKLHRLFIYIFVLFYEIFTSSFIYVANLLKREYVPVVFDMTLEVSDPVKVGIIANSITLTPGTITIDINDNVIKIMTLAKPDTPISEIEASIRNKFEKLLKEKETK